MNRVIIDRNPFEVSEGSRTDFETDDVLGLIKRELPEWPPTAKLYYESVAADHDITPISDADIEAIKKLPEGRFHVVVYPGDPGTIIVNLILAAILAAASYFLTPKLSTAPSTPADRRVDDASPNNTLSGRQNQARPNGRIPDIFGEVRSTPDLIAVPLAVFEDHVEVEYAYFCVGRGSYEVSDIRDDQTACSSIPGVAVEVYGPNGSPNTGATPQTTVGDAITRDVAKIRRLSAVNGQVLLAPNSGIVNGDADLRFEYPNIVRSLDSSEDFRDRFDASMQVTIAAAAFNNNTTRTFEFSGRGIAPNTFQRTGGAGGNFLNNLAIGNDVTIESSDPSLNGTYNVTSVSNDSFTVSGSGVPTTLSGESIACEVEVISGNLGGTFDITSVSQAVLVLTSPASVNSAWNLLDSLPNERTIGLSATLNPEFDRWVGPFLIPEAQLTKAICNFVALNGSWRDNGEKQRAVNVGLQIQMRTAAADGTPIGAYETFNFTLLGSASVRSTRALTAEPVPAAAASYYLIRARRSTDHLHAEGWQVQDEVKWRDCFGSAAIGAVHFGDVTTVWARTRATEGSLAVKDRKLNMLVTRKIKQRDGAGFTSTLHAEKKFELILYHAALDPYIGRRSISDLDLDQIDAIAADVRSYFGDDELAEFSYTFDKVGMSFEETALGIAAAACCTPYRQGNQLRLAFERENADASLLFNHRNKVPKSEVRTHRFGKVKDFDGIEFSYIDPDDDAIETYYIPTDRSATAPKKIDSIGVRSHKQAYVLAWREWNKLLYQRESVKFDALSEAELLIPNDRILVSDNTRPETMDGEVVAQSSLTLTLSQVAELDTGAAGYATFDAYDIHLQHIDGTVEVIGIKQGATTKEVLLENAPAVALSLDPQNSVRTGYIIVKAGEARTTAFLVTEREAARDRFVYPVTAINYDTRYYAEDLNFPV